MSPGPTPKSSQIPSSFSDELDSQTFPGVHLSDYIGRNDILVGCPLVKSQKSSAVPGKIEGHEKITREGQKTPEVELPENNYVYDKQNQSYLDNFRGKN